MTPFLPSPDITGTTSITPTPTRTNIINSRSNQTSVPHTDPVNQITTTPLQPTDRQSNDVIPVITDREPSTDTPHESRQLTVRPTMLSLSSLRWSRGSATRPVISSLRPAPTLAGVISSYLIQREGGGGLG
jgi:hypothetical protein